MIDASDPGGHQDDDNDDGGLGDRLCLNLEYHFHGVGGWNRATGRNTRQGGAQTKIVVV